MQSSPLILNVVHRPEMLPEYAETIMEAKSGGLEERGELLRESLDIFSNRRSHIKTASKPQFK